MQGNRTSHPPCAEAFWFIHGQGAVLRPLGIKFFPMEKADAPSAPTDTPTESCLYPAKCSYPAPVGFRFCQIRQHIVPSPKPQMLDSRFLDKRITGISMNATTSQSLFEIGVLVTGLMMLGEGKLLFFGLRMAQLARMPWFTKRNRMLLFLDIFSGFVMLAFLFLGESTIAFILFSAAAFVTILAVGYREWEYIVQRENRFCANIPQFVVNNIKLFGLLLILGSMLS